jgi:hypothetical protein
MNRQNQTRPILSVFTKPNQFSSASESMPAHAESRSWGRTCFSGGWCRGEQAGTFCPQGRTVIGRNDSAGETKETAPLNCDGWTRTRAAPGRAEHNPNASPSTKGKKHAGPCRMKFAVTVTTRARVV